MKKLEKYQLEKLKKLAKDYMENPSKNLEFSIEEITEDGGDLVKILDYIKKEYIDPYIRQEKILYEEKKKELEEEKEEFKEQLGKRLNKIRDLWNKIQSSKIAEDDLSKLLNED